MVGGLEVREGTGRYIASPHVRRTAYMAYAGSTDVAEFEAFGTLRKPTAYMAYVFPNQVTATLSAVGTPCN
jgi:hypothetical protein